jgi:hypothetical protein
LPELEALLVKIGDHWVYEDLIYRYYHHSFKVYYIQEHTKEIYNMLVKLNFEDAPLNRLFMNVYNEGCNDIKWVHEHNTEWSLICRPLVEAFFHAKYFLEMIVKYGKELETAPELLPSGWASVLTLYNLR